MLEVFACILKYLSELPGYFKIFTGIICYCVIGLAFLLPIFGLEFYQLNILRFNEKERLIVMVGYILCLLISVMFFRVRYIKCLRSMGYFKVH